MNKRMAALLGGAAALATLNVAQATVPAAPPAQPLAASSYAELLAPVPQPVEALKADDAARAQASQARVQLAQYHHHHHHFRRYHHHHHHHHSGAFIPFAIGAAIGGMMAAQPAYGPPGRSVRWCEQHYRSYDPRSGTYMGYDGHRHPCP